MENKEKWNIVKAAGDGDDEGSHLSVYLNNVKGPLTENYGKYESRTGVIFQKKFQF